MHVWYLKRTHISMTMVDPYVVCEKNTHTMTQVVVSKKSTHAMTLVDPQEDCENNTHAMTLVDPCVVSKENTHFNDTCGSICGV